jgi:hypothetical protein
VIDLEDTKVGGLDSRWTNGNDDPIKFKKQLLAQTLIWRVFLKILKELYRNASTVQTDLEKPNIQERILFNEGYKKALTDVYKLIPTQKE